MLGQWFPTCLGFRHPAEENYNFAATSGEPIQFCFKV